MRARPCICVAFLAALFADIFPDKNQHKGRKRLLPWPCWLGGWDSALCWELIEMN